MPPPVPPSVNDGRMIAGIADLLDDAQRIVERAGEAAVRDLQAEPLHRRGELLAVFRHADRARVRADQLDAVLLEHAAVVQLERDVQRGLAAHGRQQRVRPLLAR